MIPLDVRKQGILRAVVDDYVRTAEPIGSHTLAARHSFGVRSATIRSELAELAEMGYLRQPHTSAGRIPSDLGYRFFVDRLMGRAQLTASDEAGARKRIPPHSAELDIVLDQTCRILADLARYTSVATRPVVRESAIGHVSVLGVGQKKLLLVMVLDNGGVFHDLMAFDPLIGKLDAGAATSFLTRKLAGVSLERARSIEPDADTAPSLRELLGKVRQFLIRELEAIEDSDIHVGGASYIMQQPEFADVKRLEAVLSVLEERSQMYRLFSSVYLGRDATVIIGSENPVREIRDCSFVGTKYRIGERVAGTIGILGPTRMDYRRAVGAVRFMARNLEDLLTQLSSF